MRADRPTAAARLLPLLLAAALALGTAGLDRLEPASSRWAAGSLRNDRFIGLESWPATAPLPQLRMAAATPSQPRGGDGPGGPGAPVPVPGNPSRAWTPASPAGGRGPCGVTNLHWAGCGMLSAHGTGLPPPAGWV
jgi:hypothetical protein